MNSAMNIEFVYLILIGINNFMENFEGHDNNYATNNGVTLVKVEILAGQEDDVTIIEIIGYIIFTLIILLLFIPCVHAILRIKRTCNQDIHSSYATQ